MSLPRQLPVVVVAALASTTVFAAPEPPEALDAPQGAMPIDPPELPPASLDARPDTQQLGDKIMFVNFDGGNMNQCGNDDPHDNCSTLWGGTVEPYSGDAAKRATVIQIVRKRVEDFGITVTDTRPQSGDYDMEMVGNWTGVDPEFAGVAPSIDCWDQGGGETSFTLEASGTSDGIAEIILQEIAHTWGLEHIDDQSDLLYPTTQGQNKVFKDECIQIVSDTDLNPSSGLCNSVHTNFCSSGRQNSYQELLMLFGPAVADTQPPVVEILSPAEGEVIDGGDLTMVVRLEDNLTPVIINATIGVDGTGLEEPVSEDGAYAGPSELEFPISGLPDGDYTITIDATDESDNPASDQSSFTVVGNPPPETGDTGGGSGGPSDGGGSGGAGSGASDTTGADEGGIGDDDDDDDDDDDTDGATAGEDTTDDGCGCTQEPRPPLTLGALALLCLGALRRRSQAC